MSLKTELILAATVFAIATASAFTLEAVSDKDGALWAGWTFGGLIAILARDWFQCTYLEDSKKKTNT